MRKKLKVDFNTIFGVSMLIVHKYLSIYSKIVEYIRGKNKNSEIANDKWVIFAK